MKLIFSKLLSYFYLSLAWLKKAITSLLTGRLSAILTIVAVVINLLVWLVAYVLFHLIGDDLAVLHYNVVFGIDFVGNASQVFITPLIGLVTLLVNAFLGALLLKGQDKILSLMLLSLAIIVNLFCLISLYFLYLINFS
jgi:hypothetical protein